MTDHKDFKQCPGCGRWFSMKDLLENMEITPLGLTFESSDYEQNLFYFNHDATGCGTTFMVPSTWLIPAIDEPIPEQVKTLGEKCEARCVRLDDWLECHNDCYHAPFRRLLRRMARHRGIPLKDETAAVI